MSQTSVINSKSIAIVCLLAVAVIVYIQMSKSTTTTTTTTTNTTNTNTTPTVPIVPSKISISKITDANNSNGVGYANSSVAMVYDGNLSKTNVYNPTADGSINGNKYNLNILKLVSTFPGTFSVTSFEYSFINDAAHAPSKIQIYSGDLSSSLTPDSTNYVQQYVKGTDYALTGVAGDTQTVVLNLKTPFTASVVTLQIWSLGGYQNYPVELVFNGIQSS